MRQNAAARWARHSAGLGSVCVVPQAGFDYVPVPFIAVSKSEFAIVERAGRRAGIKKKRKVFNLQKVQRFGLNKHKNFQCPSEFLEFAELLRIPGELPCTQDSGPAL